MDRKPPGSPRPASLCIGCCSGLVCYMLYAGIPIRWDVDVGMVRWPPLQLTREGDSRFHGHFRRTRVSQTGTYESHVRRI